MGHGPTPGMDSAPTYSAGGNDLTDLLLRCLTQFVNRVHVKFLPVYIPTQEHISNGQAYADYSMRVMAGELAISR